MRDLFGEEITIQTTRRKKNEFGDYDAFVDKFKTKLTTDDCFTPEPVYNAVLEWVRENAPISDGCRIIRPFWPGGDYLAEDYSGDCVVVDNPPFSFLKRICDNYNRMGVRFFLFAPYLTAFAYAGGKNTVFPMSVNVVYANGAKVNTAFVSNLFPEYAVLAPSSLGLALKRAMDKVRTEKNIVSFPKYKYPANLVTPTMVGAIASRGIDFSIRHEECVKVHALDSQIKNGKGIFGYGLLVSDKVAAEKAAAEKAAAEKDEEIEKIVFDLSERERKIIERLNKGK